MNVQEDSQVHLVATQHTPSPSISVVLRSKVIPCGHCNCAWVIKIKIEKDSKKKILYHKDTKCISFPSSVLLYSKQQLEFFYLLLLFLLFFVQLQLCSKVVGTFVPSNFQAIINESNWSADRQTINTKQDKIKYNSKKTTIISTDKAESIDRMDQW